MLVDLGCCCTVRELMRQQPHGMLTRQVIICTNPISGDLVSVGDDSAGVSAGEPAARACRVAVAGYHSRTIYILPLQSQRMRC